MALFLNESDVKSVLTMSLALEAVEAAHREHGEGVAIDIPRQRTRLPQTSLHILQGALPSAGVLGYKAYTSNREGIRFFIHLCEAATGRLLAVIEANYLGMMRTGAVGGVAAKWLARADSTVLGVFGAGWQARSQIEAVCAVRPIKHVKVHARNLEKLKVFCAEMEKQLNVAVVPTESARETVEESDVVVTITNSATPVFEGDWLQVGTHLNAAGSNSLIRREIDETAIKRASLICVDSRAVALKEAGDLLPAFEKGRLHEGALVELGEVIAGVRAGRSEKRGAEQITLFESQGMAIQDIAVAIRVLALAKERGLGVELPF